MVDQMSDERGNDMDDDGFGTDGDIPGGGRSTAVVARAKPKTKKPSLYRVLVLNDDYTPMEFVYYVARTSIGGRCVRHLFLRSC